MGVSKEFILEEIRRTALADGKALGWRKFERVCEIPERERKGVYWARWSDAVREAGCHAQSMTRRRDDAELLDELAKLAVELGRMPTNADMRLRASQPGLFPSDKTYSARWATQAQLASALAAHCAGHPALGEVLPLCRPARHRRESAPPEAPPAVVDGFVYLMKSGRYYKIGQTNSPGRRHYEVALQMPEAVATVHTIRTDDPAGIEAYWHNRFAAKRMKGEWFDLSADDVAAFKRKRLM